MIIYDSHQVICYWGKSNDLLHTPLSTCRAAKHGCKKQFKAAFFTFLTIINVQLLVDGDPFKRSCAMSGQQVAHSLGCNVHVQLLK